MKRAFLVLGPECTGTRMVTDLLIQAGCLGQSTHEQYFDEHDIEGDLIVWRRSFPHFGKWIQLEPMLKRLKDYEVWAIVTTRDMNCTAQGNLKEGRVEDMADAISTVGSAYVAIFNQLFKFNIPYFISTYESYLLYGQKYIDWLLGSLNLPSVKYEIKDGNLKYYS